MNILIIPFLKSLESTSILSNAKPQFSVAEPPLCLSRPRPRAGSDSLAPGSNSSLLKPKTMVATPDQVMKLYMNKLTPYEHHEIFNYPQIYFIGANAKKRPGIIGGPSNCGYDDEQVGRKYFVFKKIFIHIEIEYFFLPKSENFRLELEK